MHHIPTYDEAVAICSRENSAFYEQRHRVDGFDISLFDYRLAEYNDFIAPLPELPGLRAHELRGLCFIFNCDGSLFKRYVLLEKFFNLNQVAESAYSVVKDYKIKYINNKEDGSIASFVRLPNGRVVGKSKMSFESSQAQGLNRIYNSNTAVRNFVDWCLDRDITAIFEYVAPHNRIVLRYSTEEVILLRLRDNKTGKHLDVRDYSAVIGDIRIAEFEYHVRDLDHLIELTATQVDKEGSIVTCVDDAGRDFFFKIKTPWYIDLHGLLTDDLYKENVIIKFVLDDKIDDVLGQIPENEPEAHARIHKIINLVKKNLSEKTLDIERSYKVFVDMGSCKKDFAIKFAKTDPNFKYVMAMSRGVTSFELAKEFISTKTSKLMLARTWLQNQDP